MIHCISKIDQKRYLCGDTSGAIILLHLDYDETRVDYKMKMNLEYLGHATVPNCISYIDNGVIYIGSIHGNSELVRLITERPDHGSHLINIQSYDNLGPIKDMLIVDLEKQGQGQLITASGAGRSGSLRIIRNGVGINESAEIELSGIKGVWPLKCKEETTNKHETLVISFVGDTLYLR